MIVGLSGYAQAGKDTVAQLMQQIEPTFQRVAFADPLREMLYALNPLASRLILSDYRDDYYVHRPVQEWVDEQGWEWAKANTTVRELLQRLGTEAGRNVLGQDIWVRTGVRKIRELEADGYDVVVTDVRFTNEAEAIVGELGEVWRIERPGTAPVNPHPSETAMDGWHFDRRIVNSGSYDDLARRVAGILEGT